MGSLLPVSRLYSDFDRRLIYSLARLKDIYRSKWLELNSKHYSCFVLT